MEQKKFKRQIENFDCLQCGRHVLGNGYTNHCPVCLISKHVDNFPGDRAADCQGVMQPIGVRVRDGQAQVLHRCLKCGKLSYNITAVEDNQELLFSLSAAPVRIE